MSEDILKDKAEQKKRSIKHFKDRIQVKHSEFDSNQLVIFYGKDKESQRNVILKQYQGELVGELIKEIKILEQI